MTLRCLLPVALCACTPDPPSSPPEPEAPVETTGVCDAGACSLESVPSNSLAMSVVVDAAGEGTGHVERDGEVVTPSASWSEGDEVRFDVLHLVPGVEVELDLIIDGEVAARWLHAPDPWPEVGPTAHVEGDMEHGGLVCTNASVGSGDPRGAHYLCVDDAGTARWSVVHPEGLAPMASFPRSDGGHVLTVRSGRVAVVDAAGRWLQEWEAPDLVGATYVHGGFDLHDAIELQQGPFAGAIAALTQTQDLVEGTQRLANGVVVFDPADGQVLWDWSAHGVLGDDRSIDPERLPYGRWGLEGEVGQDWFHANAVVHIIDNEGEGLLVSSRSQDWLLRVDVPSGQVLWRMGYEGDFQLVDDLARADPQADAGWFFHQHAPEVEVLDDGRWRMLVVDNGNVRAGFDGQPYSRLLELEVDLEARRVAATTLWGNSDPADPSYWYSKSQGDLDRLPDGSLLWLEGDEPRATWLDDDGPRGSVSYPDVGTSYRAEWRPLTGGSTR